MASTRSKGELKAMECRGTDLSCPEGASPADLIPHPQNHVNTLVTLVEQPERHFTIEHTEVPTGNQLRAR